MFFLGTFSENYVISCRVSRFFICYCDCRTFCLNAENLWCIRCDCCYRECIAVRPFTKYFLTILITCPCMAVCIVSSLWNIFEVSCCLNLILNNIDTCIFIRRIFGCGDYIIISRCAFCFIRKDNSCLVSSNLNTTNYWSTNFSNFCCKFFRTCVVFAVSFSCYSYFLFIIAEFDIIFSCRNDNSTVQYSYFVFFVNAYCCVCKVFLGYFPC